MNKYLAGGIIVGVIVATVWHNLRSGSPPPEKTDNVIDLLKPTELERTGT